MLIKLLLNMKKGLFVEAKTGQARDVVAIGYPRTFFIPIEEKIDEEIVIEKIAPKNATLYFYDKVAFVNEKGNLKGNRYMVQYYT